MKLIAPFFIAALLLSDLAWACSAPVKPDIASLDSYDQIFIGEVVSVHLTEFDRLRTEEIASNDGTRSAYVGWGGSTHEHEVTVLVSQVFAGEPETRTVMRISGCGVPLPETAADEGIFFVTADGGVVPVYRSQKFYYTDWVLKVALHFWKPSQNDVQ